MNKRFLGCIFQLCFLIAPLFAGDTASYPNFYFLTSSGFNEVYREAGELASERYSVGGDYIESFEVEINGDSFDSILDNSRFICGQGKADYQFDSSGRKVSAKVTDPWSFYGIFTLQGRIKQPLSSDQEELAINFSLTARVVPAGKPQDTLVITENFSIRRTGHLTIEQEFSNGDNQVFYNGKEGFLVYERRIPGPSYFISQEGGVSSILYYYDLSYDSCRYYWRTINSWNWDMNKARRVPLYAIGDYSSEGNIVIKPGTCALFSYGKYWDPFEFGKIREMSADESRNKYGQDTVHMPEEFLSNYQIIPDMPPATGSSSMSYNGRPGRLVNFQLGDWPLYYWVPENNEGRYVLPPLQTGIPAPSIELYRNAIAESWGWNLADAEIITQGDLEKLPLKENLIINSGKYVLVSFQEKHWESPRLGELIRITKEEALPRYGTKKIVPVPDTYFLNYDTLATTPSRTPMMKGSVAPCNYRRSVGFSLNGRRLPIDHYGTLPSLATGIYFQQSGKTILSRILIQR